MLSKVSCNLYRKRASMRSAREEVQDLERVRYVTANYERLQGLKVAPLGLMLLALAPLTLLRFDALGIAPERQEAFLAVLLFFGGMVGIMVATGVGLVVGHRYERLYGKARRRPLRRRTIVLVVVGIVAFEIGYLAYVTLQPPVYPLYLLLGLAGIVFWWPERRFRAHYLLVAAAFVVAGLLSALGVLPGSYVAQFGLLLALAGFSCLLVSVLDHRLLVKTMKPLPEDADAIR